MTMTRYGNISLQPAAHTHTRTHARTHTHTHLGHAQLRSTKHQTTAILCAKEAAAPSRSDKADTADSSVACNVH